MPLFPLLWPPLKPHALAGAFTLLPISGRQLKIQNLLSYILIITKLFFHQSYFNLNILFYRELRANLINSKFASLLFLVRVLRLSDRICFANYNRSFTVEFFNGFLPLWDNLIRIRFLLRCALPYWKDVSTQKLFLNLKLISSKGDKFNFDLMLVILLSRGIIC